MQSPSRQHSTTACAACVQVPGQPSDSDTKAALIRRYLHNVIPARLGSCNGQISSHLRNIDGRPFQLSCIGWGYDAT